VLACAAWLAAGCGGSAVPARSQSDAVAAAHTAREAGAENSPDAAYHLALAEEQVQQGQYLARQGRAEAAQRVFERAKVDAELATALSRESQVRMRPASTTQPQRMDTDGR
jgi:hypothetical protein